MDGAVIHQSGLMTGGTSGNQATTKWHQSEIQGNLFSKDCVNTGQILNMLFAAYRINAKER